MLVRLEIKVYVANNKCYLSLPFFCNECLFVLLLHIVVYLNLFRRI